MEPHEAFLKAYRTFITLTIGAALVCFAVPLVGWIFGILIIMFVGMLKLVEIVILVMIGFYLILRRLLQRRPHP
ncbi:MAG: hypothetical protein HYV42_00065 [Candidatus Magasanikbacteria bacterium]|nr:hypothetical protein [Candidatus Magasanikbacteria bacterium]